MHFNFITPAGPQIQKNIYNFISTDIGMANHPIFQFTKFNIYFYISMQIHTTQHGQSQSYTLTFNRLTFLFLSNPNLENLQYFCQTNQERLGKLDIRFNLSHLKTLPDINHLNYIVLMQYQQILEVPFILRHQTQDVKIIATKSILQSSKIYIQDFYHTIKKIDQITKTLSFDQESQIMDAYEQQFNIDFSMWATIYKKTQMMACLDRMIGINYAENYDTGRGLIMTPFPSGMSIGSACWLLEDVLKNERLLWVQNLSHHKWRACKEFSIYEKTKKIDHLVLTCKALQKTDNCNHDEIECSQFLKVIFQRLSMNKGFNSKIVLKDFLIICDIINYIYYQFADKFKKIFITGCSLSKMMCYTNSLVEYLSINHHKRIYEDPPAYPFQCFENLKPKKIYEGTLEEISNNEKLPIKELMLRSMPYLHFESDFYAYLHEDFGSVISETMFEPRVNLEQFQSSIKQLRVGNIVYFGSKQTCQKKLPQFHSKIMAVENRNHCIINSPIDNKIYSSLGQITGLVGKYKKMNGQLYLQPYIRQYRILKQNWVQKLMQQYQDNQIEIKYDSQAGQLYTQKTRIRFNKYRLNVSSESQRELLLMEKMLLKITQIYRIL